MQKINLNKLGYLKKNRHTKLVKRSLFSGVFIIFISIAIYIFFRNFVQEYIKTVSKSPCFVAIYLILINSIFSLKNAVLSESSQSFKFFMNPPATIVRRYYFFDIQNPNEFKLGKEKPILIERGYFYYVFFITL